MVKIDDKLKLKFFFIVLILWIYYLIYICPKLSSDSREYFRRLNIEQFIQEGVVTNKFIDTTFGARNAEIIFVDYKKYELFNYELYQQIKIGDKVKKDKGSNYFYINDVKYIYVDRE
ncbi:MAG: hypothetical protein J0M25_01700 [Flavobacteriales bacterium]|nr:hypothetical protein [Flavobacteriales bacterium]